MGDQRPLIRIDIETHPVEDIVFGTFVRIAANASYENAEDGTAAAVAERFRQTLHSRFPGSSFTRQVDRSVPGLGLGARIRLVAWRDGA